MSVRSGRVLGRGFGFILRLVGSAVFRGVFGVDVRIKSSSDLVTGFSCFLGC